MNKIEFERLITLRNDLECSCLRRDFASDCTLFPVKMKCQSCGARSWKNGKCEYCGNFK